MKLGWVAAIACVIGSSPVMAKPYVVLSTECNVRMPCEGGYYSERAKKFLKTPFGSPRQHYRPKQIKQGSVIGGRPSGCPARYCGCSASLYLFGKIIPRLNLASNWLSFPKTSPAPRMVAARRGHVFVLVEHKGGDKWIVHEGNSGGGMTRLHARSIAGYTVVDPHG